MTDLAISPGYSISPTLYVSIYNGGIYRSDNGDNWGLKSPPTLPLDLKIALSPAFQSDNTLFVSVPGWSAGGAFRSEDRGDTWIDITGGVLNYYVTGPAISPRFQQDRTLIIGRDSGPLYMSEDAGTTWFPLQGIPTVGGYGQKYGLTIAYRDNALLPIGSTPDALYRYRWPKLSLGSVGVGVEPGQIDPVDVQLRMIPDMDAPAPWQVSGSASWLSVTPVTGTLPATTTITLNPDGLTDTVHTTLSVDVQWSSHQVSTYTVPVSLFFVHSRVWLPSIFR